MRKAPWLSDIQLRLKILSRNFPLQTSVAEAILVIPGTSAVQAMTEICSSTSPIPHISSRCTNILKQITELDSALPRVSQTESEKQTKPARDHLVQFFILKCLLCHQNYDWANFIPDLCKVYNLINNYKDTDETKSHVKELLVKPIMAVINHAEFYISLESKVSSVDFQAIQNNYERNIQELKKDLNLAYIEVSFKDLKSLNMARGLAEGAVGSVKNLPSLKRVIQFVHFMLTHSDTTKSDWLNELRRLPRFDSRDDFETMDSLFKPFDMIIDMSILLLCRTRTPNAVHIKNILDIIEAMFILMDKVDLPVGNMTTLAIFKLASYVVRSSLKREFAKSNDSTEVIKELLRIMTSSTTFYLTEMVSINWIWFFTSLLYMNSLNMIELEEDSSNVIIQILKGLWEELSRNKKWSDSIRLFREVLEFLELDSEELSFMLPTSRSINYDQTQLDVAMIEKIERLIDKSLHVNNQEYWVMLLSRSSLLLASVFVSLPTVETQFEDQVRAKCKEILIKLRYVKYCHEKDFLSNAMSTVYFSKLDEVISKLTSMVPIGILIKPTLTVMEVLAANQRDVRESLAHVVSSFEQDFLDTTSSMAQIRKFFDIIAAGEESYLNLVADFVSYNFKGYSKQFQSLYNNISVLLGNMQEGENTLSIELPGSKSKIVVDYTSEKGLHLALCILYSSRMSYFKHSVPLCASALMVFASESTSQKSLGKRTGLHLEKKLAGLFKEFYLLFNDLFPVHQEQKFYPFGNVVYLQNPLNELFRELSQVCLKVVASTGRSAGKVQSTQKHSSTNSQQASKPKIPIGLIYQDCFLEILEAQSQARDIVFMNYLITKKLPTYVLEGENLSQDSRALEEVEDNDQLTTSSLPELFETNMVRLLPFLSDNYKDLTGSNSLLQPLEFAKIEREVRPQILVKEHNVYYKLKHNDVTLKMTRNPYKLFKIFSKLVLEEEVGSVSLKEAASINIDIIKLTFQTHSSGLLVGYEFESAANCLRFCHCVSLIIKSLEKFIDESHLNGFTQNSNNQPKTYLSQRITTVNFKGTTQMDEKPLSYLELTSCSLELVIQIVKEMVKTHSIPVELLMVIREGIVAIVKVAMMMQPYITDINLEIAKVLERNDRTDEAIKLYEVKMPHTKFCNDKQQSDLVRLLIKTEQYRGFVALFDIIARNCSVKLANIHDQLSNRKLACYVLRDKDGLDQLVYPRDSNGRSIKAEPPEGVYKDGMSILKEVKARTGQEAEKYEKCQYASKCLRMLILDSERWVMNTGVMIRFYWVTTQKNLAMVYNDAYLVCSEMMKQIRGKEGDLLSDFRLRFAYYILKTLNAGSVHSQRLLNMFYEIICPIMDSFRLRMCDEIDIGDRVNYRGSILLSEDLSSMVANDKREKLIDDLKKKYSRIFLDICTELEKVALYKFIGNVPYLIKTAFQLNIDCRDLLPQLPATFSKIIINLMNTYTPQMSWYYPYYCSLFDDLSTPESFSESHSVSISDTQVIMNVINDFNGTVKKKLNKTASVTVQELLKFTIGWQEYNCKLRKTDIVADQQIIKKTHPNTPQTFKSKLVYPSLEQLHPPLPRYDQAGYNPFTNPVYINGLNYEKKKVYGSKEKPVNIPCICSDKTTKSIIIKYEDNTVMECLCTNFFANEFYKMKDAPLENYMTGLHDELAFYLTLPCNRNLLIIEFVPDCSALNDYVIPQNKSLLVAESCQNIHNIVYNDYNYIGWYSRWIMSNYSHGFWSFVTYFLGIGDRNLMNSMIQADKANFFCIDFEMIMGLGKLLWTAEILDIRVGPFFESSMGLSCFKGLFRNTLATYLGLFTKDIEKCLHYFNELNRHEGESIFTAYKRKLGPHFIAEFVNPMIASVGSNPYLFARNLIAKCKSPEARQQMFAGWHAEL